MRRTIAVAVLCLGLAIAAAVLLVPAPGAACSPCRLAESGEHWDLEIVSWTVDDAEMPLPDAGTRFSVSNPYYVERIDPADPPPDLFVDAELFDPRAPDTARTVSLTREQP